jgi:hypothetical protein
MSTPSARTLAFGLPFLAALAAIFVLGFALAPGQFEFRSWPAPPSTTQVDDVPGRERAEDPVMPLADPAATHDAGAERAVARRAGARRERDAGERRAARTRNGARAGRNGRGPISPPAETPAQAPAETVPETPATTPEAAPARSIDGELVAEVAPSEQALRPSEPEAPVEVPVPPVVVGRDADDDADRPGRHGRGRWGREDRHGGQRGNGRGRGGHDYGPAGNSSD